MPSESDIGRRLVRGLRRSLRCCLLGGMVGTTAWAGPPTMPPAQPAARAIPVLPTVSTTMPPAAASARTPAAPPGVMQWWVRGQNYASVRAAVIEAIEGEGLVASPPLDFADMLARTGPALGRTQSPVQQAEILQFCSARLAWRLLEEAPAQLALCPLSIAISQPQGETAIVLSWRLPAGDSPGQRGVRALFDRLLARVRAELP